MNNKAVVFGVAALLGLFSMSAEATKYFKCVDKNGQVQYVSVLPPDCKVQDAVQMEEGHAVHKKEEKKVEAAHVATPEEIEQQRRDDALLGAFSNEHEIDLARDRNLAQINVRISAIQQRMKTAQEDMDGYKKEMDARASAGKPVDKGLQDLYDQSAAKYAKLQADLAESQAEAEKIRVRYDADKKRFHELSTAPPPQKKK